MHSLMMRMRLNLYGTKSSAHGTNSTAERTNSAQKGGLLCNIHIRTSNQIRIIQDPRQNVLTPRQNVLTPRQNVLTQLKNGVNKLNKIKCEIAPLATQARLA
jgi:hypothetical protein